MTLDGSETLPAPSTAFKRGTSRAGPNAGGDDARTARERGDKPRPQEPHSPRQSAVAGDAPSEGEIRWGVCNCNGDDCQEYYTISVTTPDNFCQPAMSAIVKFGHSHGLHSVANEPIAVIETINVRLMESAACEVKGLSRA